MAAETHKGFITDEVDWQVRIEDGAKPNIHKVLISYRKQDFAPQFTAIFSNWN